MDWTKFNETVDLSNHAFDEYIRACRPSKDSETKQMYVSTAGAHNNTYTYLMKQYKDCLDKLAFERSCRRPIPILIKVTEDFAKYLEANCKADVSYDINDMQKGIYSHFTGIPIFVDDELKDKHYEFEFYDEQEEPKLKRGLRSKIPHLCNDVMTEDGLTLLMRRF